MPYSFVHTTQVLRITIAFFALSVFATAAKAQTPLPSPRPAPTPITKTGSIPVNSGSTVGQISKWVTSSTNGIGTLGDSGIVESSIGTIGIGINPFIDFKVAVDGGNSGGIYSSSPSGRSIFGTSSNGNSVIGISTSAFGIV